MAYEGTGSTSSPGGSPSTLIGCFVDSRFGPRSVKTSDTTLNLGKIMMLEEKSA